MHTVVSSSRALLPRRRDALQALLQRAGIGGDSGVERVVDVEDDDGRAVATGGRQENVLKCIAVDPEAQGEGLAATVVTELVKDAVACGYRHLFIFTAPKSSALFTQLGFYVVAGTSDAVLLENRAHGVERFVASLERPCPDVSDSRPVSAIVANCNPFTFGHRYLIETAARESSILHLFILSAEKGMFSAADRMAMVKSGVADLLNVVVHPTSEYLISAATFPSYFIKDRIRAAGINCTLDLTVFAECFAKPLGIVRRYVGTEPADEVTRAYNAQMHEVLPGFGIDVVEAPRLERDGAAVSASCVRALLDDGDFDAIARIAPRSTVEFLRDMRGR